MPELSPYQRRAVARYAQEDQPMPDPGTPSPTSQVCAPKMQVMADRIGWGKVIAGAIVGVVAAVIAVALYVNNLATHDEVKSEAAAEVQRHAVLPGHPEMVHQMQGVNDRLIVVETLQRTMTTTQTRMEDKLDRALDVLRVISTYPLLPRNSTIATNPAAPPNP